MPTLNASSSDREIAWPRKRKTISPCFVPAPPGVAGKSVASESTTCARSALWIDRVHAERLAGRSRATRSGRPTRSPAARSRRARSARRSARIAKPSLTRSQKSSTRPRAQKKSTTAGQRRGSRARSRSSCSWREEEPPVDGRDARVDLVRRQHADRERPDHQRAGDDEVEDRLDDERRGERRVASTPRCGA